VPTPLPAPFARPRPLEVFKPWTAALRLGRTLARRPPPDPYALRCSAHLEAPVARAIADWFTAPRAAPTARERAAYRALDAETARLFALVTADPADGGLGVEVRYVRHDPYPGAAALCADLRHLHRMQLRTSACDPAHPLLDSAEGGTVDRLRVVHDVLGHAALGLGFDLDAEFATWLQCRVLFGPEARRAAFTELVGAVTAFVATGRPPGLRAGLAPVALERAAG
jgi:hypothetical protein